MEDELVVLGLQPGSDPPWIDLGDVAVGQRVTHAVVLRNEGGSARLRLGAVLPPFSAGLDRTQLEPQGKARLELHFAPTQIGVREAFVEVEAEGRSTRIRVHGTGVGSTASCLQVEPALVDFGSREIGCAPSARTLSVTNGCESSEWIDLRIVRGGDGFRILSSPGLPMALEPGESLEIDMGFAPPLAGTFEGRLAVSSSSAQTSVPLAGVGAVPRPLEVEARFESQAAPLDLLFVIDESTATTDLLGAQLREVADHLESVARSGTYDLRVAATSATGANWGRSGCGNHLGDFLPRGAPEILEDASRDFEGLADRVVALLSPPACEASAQPVEASRIAYWQFMKGRDVPGVIFYISARDDVGTLSETLVSHTLSIEGRRPLVLVAGPAKACGATSTHSRLRGIAGYMGGEFLPICDPWIELMERMTPRWPPGSTRANGVDRLFLLDERPIDRNLDGMVDERDLTVFLDGVEVPPDADTTWRWRYSATTRRIYFHRSLRPRDVETVRVVYATDLKPQCSGLRLMPGDAVRTP